MALILVIENENLLRWSLQQRLERANHSVRVSPDLAAAALHIEKHQPDLMILGLGLPDGDGLDFYASHQEALEGTAVLVLAAASQVGKAVRAMKLGAREVLGKPVDLAVLMSLIDRALAERLEAAGARPDRLRLKPDASATIVGSSPLFRTLLGTAEKVARSELTSLLVLGETGTGKNLIARHLHAASPRHAKPFIEVSCANMPANPIESELFGHEAGTFPGARTTKRGAFERAEGGTVMIDHISELRVDLQARLVRLLEERLVHRVGGTSGIRVDFFLVAVTNRDLQQLVRERRFRGDLYYRLAALQLTVPPLRERSEDIVPLARHLLARLQKPLGRRCAGFDNEAEELLRHYSWPGNVRELRNVIERALVVERGTLISLRSLLFDAEDPPDEGAAPAPSQARSRVTHLQPLEEMERDLVTRALRTAGDNQTRAAELLGVSRDQLRYRMKKFGLRLGESAGKSDGAVDGEKP